MTRDAPAGAGSETFPRRHSIFDLDLDPTAANYTPLSPLSFLVRAAMVYPDRTAVIHGGQAWSYRELRERCQRLASALARWGVGQDRKSVV